MGDYEDEEIDYDSMIDTFLKGPEGQTLWVRAEDVDVRVGLIHQFSWMFEKVGAKEAIEYIKSIEKYIRYGE